MQLVDIDALVNVQIQCKKLETKLFRGKNELITAPVIYVPSIGILDEIAKATGTYIESHRNGPCIHYKLEYRGVVFGAAELEEKQ